MDQITPSMAAELPRKGPTAELLGEVADIAKPIMAEQFAELSEHVSDRIESSIENMDEQYGKMTIAALWPTLPSPVRVLSVLAIIASVVIAGLLAVALYQQPGTYGLLDVALVSAMPLVGVTLLLVLPVKTLALGTTKLAAEAMRRRLAHSEQTSNVSQSTNAAKSAINELTDSASAARKAINSEH